MRKLTYYVATSIDGAIAGPAGETDFFPVDDDMLGHIAEAYPDTLPTHLRDAYGLDGTAQRFDTVVMGRRTYQPALDVGITSPYGHLHQYVVSSTLEHSPDPDVAIVRDDPRRAVQELKRAPGREIWLAGGAVLAGALLAEIDELIVKTYPVVAGAGIPMFCGPVDGSPFQLVASRSFASGSTVTTYLRSGPAGPGPEPPRS